MKPGTTRDPILTHQQEEAFREQVSREMYWGPDSLRGFAKRWLDEAKQALHFGQYQMAARFTTLAADCQAKALELERRGIVERLAEVTIRRPKVSDEYGRETGEDYDDRDPCVCGHPDCEHNELGCLGSDQCPCQGFHLDRDTTPLEAE
jgi:hypothetical protein